MENKVEKKGDPLNQLAILSDLIENIHLETISNIILFTLNDVEFERVFKYIQNKQKKVIERPLNDTFNITIGKLEIVFNKSNV